MLIGNVIYTLCTESTVHSLDAHCADFRTNRQSLLCRMALSVWSSLRRSGSPLLANLSESKVTTLLLR